jgi:hypothetical protein
MQSNTRVHSYIITNDTGFAPNPFWGFCTLANCKPVIRRTAHIGEWVVGLSPKSTGHKLIYVMRIDEKLTYHQYFTDPRFADKKPDLASSKVLKKCGDNIYEPLANGEFRQLHSAHSHQNGSENPKNKDRDLRGKNVLVSRTFHYFGRDGLTLPEALHPLKTSRGHKNKFSPELVDTFLSFIAKKTKGVHAAPTKWPLDDMSWREKSDENNS